MAAPAAAPSGPPAAAPKDVVRAGMAAYAAFSAFFAVNVFFRSRPIDFSDIFPP